MNLDDGSDPKHKRSRSAELLAFAVLGEIHVRDTIYVFRALMALRSLPLVQPSSIASMSRALRL
jgi:hypothetical protein